MFVCKMTSGRITKICDGRLKVKPAAVIKANTEEELLEKMKLTSKNMKLDSFVMAPK